MANPNTKQIFDDLVAKAIETAKADMRALESPTMKGLLQPFMYARIEGGKYSYAAKIRDWAVVVGHTDLTHYDCAWMNYPELGDDAFVPSLDIAVGGLYVFPTQLCARQFVKEWWKQVAV